MTKGSTITEEHKAVISATNKGRKFTLEHRQKLSEAHKGLKQSAETIQKRVSKIKGKKKTVEFVKGMSGDKNHGWQGFILCADTPNEGKLYFKFDGDTPGDDCREMFGFGTATITLIKSGGKKVIKRRMSTLRHPFIEGTILSAELIKGN